jgi:hypothetical protein
MNNYQLTKYQKYAFTWLKVFTVICACCSLAILFIPRQSSERAMTTYDLFAMLLPFVHFGIWAVVSGIQQLITIIGEKSLYSPYIKNNYPKIWKKLHPWGDVSHSPWSLYFVFKGHKRIKDETINEICSTAKIQIKLLILPFLLVVIVWIVNILFILIRENIIKA